MKHLTLFLRSGFKRPLIGMARTCMSCHHYNDGYCTLLDAFVESDRGCDWFC